MTEDGARPTRWVRVMADYCSSGLWEPDGCMMGEEDLPISAGLLARLTAWRVRYERFEGWLPPETRTPFDLPDFSRDGLAIAKAIKTELPDWTVIYFDEWAAEQFPPVPLETGPRGTFEYEVQAP